MSKYDLTTQDKILLYAGLSLSAVGFALAVWWFDWKLATVLFLILWGHGVQNRAFKENN